MRNPILYDITKLLDGTREAEQIFYKCYQWKQCRKSILERDNNECQHCKAKG